MDDLISRQAAIDAMMILQAEDEETYGCSIPEGFDGERAKEVLEALPSAQPEIIRCKDCKHWYDAPVIEEYNSCELDALIRHKDFYCANAERRNDD